MLIIFTAFIVFTAGSLLHISRHLDTGIPSRYQNDSSLLTTAKYLPLTWSPVYLLLTALLIGFALVRYLIGVPLTTPYRIIGFLELLVLIGSVTEYALNARQSGNFYVND